MKKIKWLLSILIICLTFAIVGCGKALAVPENLAVEDNVLSWTAVENATNYIIDINGDEKITAKTTYSLSMLTPGDYVIKVRARDSKNEFSDSDWSEELQFTREYESGLIYTPINSNSEYAVKGVGTARGTVVIEDNFKGKPVTQILDRAFFACGTIDSVVIGKNVKTIGDKAFQNCSFLASVTIPEGVTSIGESAFQGCRGLTSITIPSTVKEISTAAFRFCSQLKDINLNAVEKIGESAFDGCKALESITVPDTVKEIGAQGFGTCSELKEVDLGNGVEIIKEHAFDYCSKLESVKGGNSLTEIQEWAFARCKALTSFNFGENVVKIGESCFSQCELLSQITINGNLASIGKDAFASTEVTQIHNGLIYAGNWVVGSDKTLTEVTFLEDTVGVGDYAFRNSAIIQLRVPASVKYIGNYAFANCDSLNYLNIGTGVINIGSYAFANCKLLGQGFVSLGTKIEVIQRYAFYGCTNLGSPAYMQYNPITLPATLKSIGAYAFRKTMFWNNTEEGQVVYVDKWAVGFVDSDRQQFSAEIKDDVIGISDYAFYNCKSLNSITIGEGVSNIGSAAFYNCTGLAQVLVSNGSDLDYLADYMFYGCTNLQSIRLPVTLRSIGRSAFYKSGLMTITISKWIDEIGPYAFYGCTSLLVVDFADLENSRLTSLSDYMFAGCNNLKRIELPDSVKNIGYKTFYKCSGLETLTLGNGLEYIGDYAFYYCAGLSSLELPDSLAEIGEKAFYKCSGLKTVDFGAGLKNIKARAFYNCSSIEGVVFPEALETIGEYAFKGCAALKSVVLSENIKNIGEHAFYGCKYMTVYCEADSLPEGWNARWNSGMRPVVFGCTLSEDKNYVVSFVNSKANVLNDKAKNGFAEPSREGYVFAGWKTSVDGEEKIFSLSEYSDIPEDATITVIWQESN